MNETKRWVRCMENIFEGTRIEPKVYRNVRGGERG